MSGWDDRSGVDRYHGMLLRHPLLEPAEEHALAVRYRSTRCPAAEARLVSANLRLVVKIALEYRRSRSNVLDLIQDGNLGLLHAVRKFDPQRGVKLASYAAWWIRSYILKSIRSDWHLVKITASRAHFKIFFGLSKTREKLEKQGLPIDSEHLAGALDVGERDVTAIEQQVSVSCASLDAAAHSVAGEEERRTLGDALCGDPAWRPDVRLETAEVGCIVRESVRALSRTLGDRELDVLHDRLSSDDPATQAELAGRLGVTRAQVRHIEEGIKKRLRRRLTAELTDAL